MSVDFGVTNCYRRGGGFIKCKPFSSISKANREVSTGPTTTGQSFISYCTMALLPIVTRLTTTHVTSDEAQAAEEYGPHSVAVPLTTHTFAPPANNGNPGLGLTVFGIPVAIAAVAINAGQPWSALSLVFLCFGFVAIAGSIQLKDINSEFAKTAEQLVILLMAIAFFSAVAFFLPPWALWVPPVCLIFTLVLPFAIPVRQPAPGHLTTLKCGILMEQHSDIVTSDDVNSGPADKIVSTSKLQNTAFHAVDINEIFSDDEDTEEPIPTAAKVPTTEDITLSSKSTAKIIKEAPDYVIQPAPPRLPQDMSVFIPLIHVQKILNDLLCAESEYLAMNMRKNAKHIDLFQKAIVHDSNRKKEIDALIKEFLLGKYATDPRPVSSVVDKESHIAAPSAVVPTATDVGASQSKKQRVQSDVQSSASDTSENVELSSSNGDDDNDASSASTIPSYADKTSTEA